MRWIEARSKLCAAAVLSIAGSGCSGSGDTSPAVFSPVGPDGQELTATAVSCAGDPRVDTYSASMNKPGELGRLSFRFTELEPAPPAKGTNTFHLQISDANGAPVTGDLGVDLLMPDHGHGTSVTPAVTLDPTTNEYTVTPLYLFMAGVWRIQFNAYAGSQNGSTPLDRATVFFCIEG
jgi:hypothetical protein